MPVPGCVGKDSDQNGKAQQRFGLRRYLKLILFATMDRRKVEEKSKVQRI